jgi:hypothetical protein
MKTEGFPRPGFGNRFDRSKLLQKPKAFPESRKGFWFTVLVDFY